MRKYMLTLCLTALLPVSVQADNTWRCRQNLVTLSARTFEVKQKCGAPAVRDVVGYSTDDNGNLQLQI